MQILNRVLRKMGLQRQQDLFTGHYDEWRAKRIAAILAYYSPTFFLGKSVLEVGCGHADIGNVFSKLGSRVTCSDARSKHLAVVRKRYPEVSTIQANLEDEWPFAYHDIIIHMGVLYHLKHFIKPLENACRSCRFMILETEVADSDDPAFALSVSEKGFDQAISGTGIRPSAEAIESVLRSCGVRFERILDARCNSGIHRYDWPVTNSNKWEHGLRRFWFIERP